MFIQVAIDCPLHTTFVYRAGEYSRIPAPGSRVLVPFGNRKVVGVVTASNIHSEVPDHKIKSVLEILDEVPSLSDEIMSLLVWAAAYYVYPLGQAIFNALPPNLRKHSTRPIQTETWWSAVDQDSSSLARAPRQLALWEWLHQRNSAVSESDIRQEFTTSRKLLNALLEKGFIQRDNPAQTSISRVFAPSSAVSLNKEQQLAADRIMASLEEYQCFLLDGVTGSGKTEVYIAAMRSVLAQGKQILVLAPEIGLTPQLQTRLQQATGVSVGLLHSGLTGSSRLHTWQQARDGTHHILVGTRSAVFAPLPKIGLIIVDEEHDVSFKQQEGFLYNARDIAIYRAHRNNIPIVLGSATPSFESLQNTYNERYTHLTLRQRAGHAQLPRLTVVDLRNATTHNGLSTQAIQRIRAQLEQNKQILLFLNRRGYAPTLICYGCGWIAQCTRCDARMTLHKTRSLLICHHCERTTEIPDKCPDCHATPLQALGEGTQRIEETLVELFPDAELVRLDRDSTRGRGQLEAGLDSIQSGRRQLIVGTQMISKGHDLPNVSLVVIVNLDQGFYSTDFRSLERTSQLLLQVAGRAGRRTDPGEVLIQTHFPDHPYMKTLLTDGYISFAQSALESRQASNNPPYVFHIALRARSQQSHRVYTFLKAVRRLSQKTDSFIQIMGPIPSAMEKKAGFVRAYLLFAHTSRTRLGNHVSGLYDAISSLPQSRQVRWALDVDPLDSE